MNEVLAQLEATLEQRKSASPEKSYVASLHDKGLNKILEKVGEEAVELILAARDLEQGGSREALVGEVADLWFHTMVALSHLNVPLSDVSECLAGRFDISGLDEKASRSPGTD